MKLLTAAIYGAALAPFVVRAQQPSVPFNHYQGIYGQPKQEETVIVKGNKGSNYQLSVYDAAGKAVLQKALDTVETALSSCRFKRGAYTYVITDQRRKVVKKGSFTVLF